MPIATLSANILKRLCATNFSMAYREFNRLVQAIVKANEKKDSNIGIESTIISFDLKDNVIILRPGAITKKMLQEALKGKYTVNYATTEIDF
ncbi:Telomere recombination [Borreliella japonica]|uniref:Telomere recombination n=1 Tax=Borreliella japonica TaxID=34095 RepID=A0A1G4QIN5_BORJA|nr:Telomere recombination [Borreliella japonica]